MPFAVTQMTLEIMILSKIRERQGYTSLPMLFNIVLQALTKALKQKEKLGYKLEKRV